MPHFSLADVQGWAVGLTAITSTTTPSDAVVTGWVADYNGKLDAALSRGNAVAPLSAAEELELKIAGAHAVVWEVMATKGTAKDLKMPSFYSGWMDDFNKLVSEIEAGRFAVETFDLPDSFTRDADPCDQTDPRNPIFTRDYEP